MPVPETPGYRKNCIECGIQFYTQFRKLQFCSEKCKNKRSWKKEKGKK